MELTGENALVEHFFRHEYGRLVAGLVHRFGARWLSLAEDAVQAALLRAVQSWPRRGVPDNPAAWLRRAAYNSAIDSIRREATFAELLPKIAPPPPEPPPPDLDRPLDDDPLRLLFICCHPELSVESQLALSLKVVCGFGVTEIARGLLATEAAVLKRLTRAKEVLREAGMNADPLPEAELLARRDSVHAILYLLFNEGYHSSRSDALLRHDLCEEAIRQADMLARHPTLGSPAGEALLALMLLHAARFDARQEASGELVLLEDQDRERWDRSLIVAGMNWLSRAARGEQLTAYHLEAAIAAEHCRAASYATTDWKRIVELYDLLCRLKPNWLSELNRAIAVGCLHGPRAGLRRLLEIEKDTGARYSHLHTAIGELYRRCGESERARQHFAEALKLAANDSEKEHLLRRLQADSSDG